MVGVAARLAAGFLPAIVAEVTIAILLGAVIAAFIGPRSVALEPGLRFAAQQILRLGIVLLGARLSLAEIARIGLPATGVIIVSVTVSFGVVLAVARALRVEGRLALLIAVGSAICGNSAIVATAPVIGARARDVAYAVATITLFGTLAVFLYPAIGRAVDIEQHAFGLWAGVAVHDTSQVVATGAAYGPEALDVATVVKLIRNALMAPLLVLIAVIWAARLEGTGRSVKGGVRRAVPLFVLGFLGFAAFRSVGWIDAGQAATLDTMARAFVLVALAAVGMSIRFDELRETSWRPIAVGFSVALGVGLVSLFAITVLRFGTAFGG